MGGPKEVTDLERHQGDAIAPHTPEAEHLNLLWKLARMTTDTEMVPRTLRKRPDAALAVMVYGHELGLRPMTALREIFIIEGTPSCSARLMRSLIYRAGHRLEFREQSRTQVVVYGERCDGQGTATVTWDIEDARAAGLVGKDVWKRYPRQMLTARATSELARLIFADVTIGYTPEELSRVDLSGEHDYVDVEEVDTPPVDADGVIDADEFDEEPPVEDAPPAPVPTGGPTKQQTRHVMALFGELGITDRAERLVRTGELVGRTVGSWNDVTPDEAERVLTALAHQRQGVA
jgi:hypothetical protein